MARHRPHEPETMAEAFEGARADYQAAKASSRYRRRRVGIAPMGSGADYHYRSEADYLRLMEQARDMDRNDLMVGAILDQAVTSWLRSGFTLDIDTGNPQIDDQLTARWKAWSESPESCELSGEHAWADVERHACRAMLADGDQVLLPTQEGQVQLIEAHRVRTPHRTKRNIIHGVQLDETRRRVAYWVTKDDIDPLATAPMPTAMTAIPTRDADGERQVFHVYKPKRCTQTRGVSALTPIFDALGMFEDIQFARLVQQQVVSCFAVFRQMSQAGASLLPQQTGNQEQTARPDGSIETIQGIAPGMQIYGRPGETLTGFSPATPNAEFFPHVRMILQLIGINLGLPLVMVLLDASETNYSGWRGAVEAAREGFRFNQTLLMRRLHTPVYRWKLRQWISEDPALLAALRELGPARLFAHTWAGPEWPYIDPTKDTAAELTQRRNGMNSPRRLHNARGSDFYDVTEETIADQSWAIEQAAKEAKALSAKIGEKVHWRELLYAPTPDGVTVALAPEPEPAAPPATKPRQESGGRTRPAEKESE